mgnify:CR=1 FL=1
MTDTVVYLIICTISGFMGALLKVLYDSKCVKIHLCCGLADIERDVMDEIRHDELINKIYAVTSNSDAWSSLLDDLSSLTDSFGSALSVERNNEIVGWRVSNSLKKIFNLYIRMFYFIWDTQYI